MARRDDIGGRDLRHLRDVVDDRIELTGEAPDLLVAQLDPGEDAEMAHEIWGDFRHPDSLVRPRRTAGRP
ncbi:hypothetical protein GCM10009862_16820 [Microbacterium binotii]|uniref:Uncharacterized protein n=1 Tax=Microbacterium binotii TaxID=462710 RepID=A0ABN3PEK7_9MICO